MKKKLILLAGIAIALAACTKNELRDDSTTTEPVSWPSVITVATEPVVDSETKSVIASDGTFSWFAGTGETAEKLGINTDAGFKVYTCTDAAAGTFGGDLEGATPSTVAVYPAGQYALSTKTLTVTMPASYEYVATLAKTPMIAQISGSIDNLAFKHIAALLKVSISNVPPTATQLVLETDENIAGDFVISDCTVADAVITNAGGSVKSVAVNFPAAGDFSDKDFFIPIPVGTYAHFNLFLKDADGNKLAGRQFKGTTIARKNLASGSAIELLQLKQRCVLKNDTQLGIQWSVADFANNATDRSKEWTFGVYSNVVCNDASRLWEWHTDASAIKPSNSTTLAGSGNLFTGKCGHQFSGLTPGETYYIKIADKTDGVVSIAMYTLDPEDANIVLSKTPSVNDVVLSQNFNELKWGGGDPVNGLTGYSADNRNTENPQSNPSGVQYWYNKESLNGSSKQFLVQPGTDMGLFSTIKASLASTSLSDWHARYNNTSNPNACSGYVRMNGSGYIVSPALTCLPSGQSNVRVTFTAKGQIADVDAHVAVFPEEVTATTGQYISTDALTDYKVTSKIVNEDWNTYSIEIAINKGQRIGIGSPIGDPQMFYLNDIKVEYLGSAPALVQRLEYVNNSQIAVRWSTTAFQTPATDLSKAYTFGIYSDAECTTPVYRTFSTTDGNKDASATAQTAFVSGYCPGFVFSGLTSGQDYYVKIVQGTNESIEKYTTTDLYPSLKPVKPGIAVAGDVILYEDFNEIMFTGDFISKLSGYWTSGDYKTGYFGLPVEYSASKGNYIHQAVDQNWNLLSGAWGGSANAKTWLDGTTSFKNWNYYNTAPVSGPGYLKLYGDGQLRQIVSPQISCLSGNAMVKVRVKACASSGVKVVVKVFPAAVDVANYKITTAPLDTPAPIQLTVNTYTSGWSYAEGTISLEPGQRIGLAATGQAWLDEVKVELVSYDD